MTILPNPIFFGKPLYIWLGFFEFAAKLGIDASKPDERGYPFDLMKKKGLIK